MVLTMEKHGALPLPEDCLSHKVYQGLTVSACLLHLHGRSWALRYPHETARAVHERHAEEERVTRMPAMASE